ncbi:MAG: hypothetical protein QM751_12530 [Paludibacteraceae bacterium]
MEDEPVIDIKQSNNILIKGNKNNRKKVFEVVLDESTRKTSKVE